jgi:hypothetical protein
MVSLALKKTSIIKYIFSQALLAHTCKPSYSGGRDQEDQCSEPSPGKEFIRPYLKKKTQKTMQKVPVE